MGIPDKNLIQQANEASSLLQTAITVITDSLGSLISSITSSQTLLSTPKTNIGMQVLQIINAGTSFSHQLNNMQSVISNLSDPMNYQTTPSSCPILQTCGTNCCLPNVECCNDICAQPGESCCNGIICPFPQGCINGKCG